MLPNRQEWSDIQYINRLLSTYSHFKTAQTKNIKTYSISTYYQQHPTTASLIYQQIISRINRLDYHRLILGKNIEGPNGSACTPLLGRSCAHVLPKLLGVLFSFTHFLFKTNAWIGFILAFTSFVQNNSPCFHHCFTSFFKTELNDPLVITNEFSITSVQFFSPLGAYSKDT